MQLAAGFIEYFITGSGALLWLVPLFATVRPQSSDVSAGTVLLLAPVLYAFGMAIDVASNTLLSKPIRHIHASHKEKLLPDGISDTAFISYRSATLGHALELRSTRDRIARGFFFNLVVTTLVVSFRDISWLLPVSRFALVTALVLLTVIAFGAWWRFERLTHRLKKQAVRVILLGDGGNAGFVEPSAR